MTCSRLSIFVSRVLRELNQKTEPGFWGSDTISTCAFLGRVSFRRCASSFRDRILHPRINNFIFILLIDRCTNVPSFLSPDRLDTIIYIREEQSWLIVENRTDFDWPFKQENRIYYKSELKSWSIAAHGCVELRKRVSVSSSFNWRTLNGNGVVSAFTERRVTSGYVIQISFDRINTQDRSGGGGGGGDRKRTVVASRDGGHATR